MKYHLSVTQDCYLTIQGQDGRAKQVRVEEALGIQKCFDWYGNTFPVNVLKSPSEEPRLMTSATSGEAMVFGATHSVLCRGYDSPRWERRMLSDLTEPVLVQVPQRKIYVDTDIFEYFELDDSGIYLQPPRASDLPLYARKAAWVGIYTQRRKTEVKIDLDRRRPPCFATKCLAGSFMANLDGVLAPMVRNGVVRPPMFYDDAYLEMVKKTGIIFEGWSVLNTAPLLPPTRLEKPGEVYHIRFDNPLSPVELTWFHS